MLAEEITTERMARGYHGTSRTIDLMHKLAQKAKLDPTMHRIASWIRATVPDDYRGSTRATADAIFNWVKRHGLFQRDQFQIERVEHPISSMQSMIMARKNGLDTRGKLFAGDCDQFAIWVATLGGILGFQYAFETSKSDLERPDEFSHVWAALLVGPDWVAYDASTKGATPNWRPPIPSPDKFKRWPEKEIEKSGVGMLGEVPFGVPADYFGNNIPDDSPIDPMLDVDPGRLDMLPPEQPALSEGDIEGGIPMIQKVDSPSPSDRMSLINDDDTGPHYRAPGNYPRYKVRKDIYPPRSPWNRLGVSSEDRSRGEPYYKIKPSNLPTYNVTPSSVTPVTLDGIDERPRVVRRNIKSVLIVRRPQMTPAGMAAISLPTSVTQTAVDAGTDAAKATVAGNNVWDTITDVTKALAPAAQAAVLAKYAPTVAGATNKVAGQNVVTPSSYLKPWWMQGWFLAGLAVVVGGGAAVVLLKPAKRRRR